MSDEGRGEGTEVPDKIRLPTRDIERSPNSSASSLKNSSIAPLGCLNRDSRG